MSVVEKLKSITEKITKLANKTERKEVNAQ